MGHKCIIRTRSFFQDSTHKARISKEKNIRKINPLYFDISASFIHKIVYYLHITKSVTSQENVMNASTNGVKLRLSTCLVEFLASRHHFRIGTQTPCEFDYHSTPCVQVFCPPYSQGQRIRIEAKNAAEFHYVKRTKMLLWYLVSSTHETYQSIVSEVIISRMGRIRRHQSHAISSVTAEL